MHTIYDDFRFTDSLRVPKLRVFLLESIVYMFEKYNSDKPQPGLIRPKEKVKQAILYINTNFANHITIDDEINLKNTDFVYTSAATGQHFH